MARRTLLLLLPVPLLAAVVTFGAAPASAASKPVGSNMGGPTTYTLTVTGQRSGGAEIETKIARPLDVGLVVSRDNASTLSEPNGLVPLGTLPKGTYRIAWNYKIDGLALAPGRYYVSLEIFTSAGVPKGLTFPPSAVLSIASDGATTVNMLSGPGAGSPWWVVLLVALGAVVIGLAAMAGVARRRAGPA